MKIEKMEAEPGVLQDCPRYKFKNVTSADLLLQEPLPNGRKMIRPGEEFVGGACYQKLSPYPLLILAEIQSTKLQAPSLTKEVEQLLSLGEKVVLEKKEEGAVTETKVLVEEQKKKMELTPELLKDFREVQKLSWSQIASKAGYSLTYIRKVCRKNNIA